MSFKELPPPSDGYTTERIESYMKSHYSLVEIRIRHFENRFYVVLPENENCRPCYYHIVAATESDITEPFAFYGTGTLATRDAPWWPDKHFGDQFAFYLI